MHKRYIFVQPTLPSYRVPLYERLAAALGGQFSVYSSDEQLGVLTERATSFAWHSALGPVRKIAPGLQWQSGALSIKVRRGDVLVIAGEPRRISNIVLMLKARLFGATTIWWGHYWSSTSRSWRFAIRYLLMRLAKVVVFYTDDEATEYESRAGNRKQSVYALNNGLETREIRALRVPYDPGSRGRRVFFIGRLTDKANLGLLLEALTYDECLDVVVEVIGSGPEEHRLRRQAEQRGLADRIRWHPGTLDEQLIATVANRCAIFVYPGGVGLSLIHAFAYGLPAIVHDNRWRQMPEIAAFRPELNGLHFEFGNSYALAASIARALGDDTRLRLMSAQALETVEKTFNVDDMAVRFLDALSGDHRQSVL